MRFVADEGVDYGIVRGLRANGFEVWAVVENIGGSSDLDVLAVAIERDSVLLTEDKDFGDLVFKSNLPHKGVVLFRLSGLSSAEKKATAVSAILQNQKTVIGHFSVIAKNKFRTRKSP